ncbi:Uncharacterised protein [Chlamydia trachomatis]|nr:Uncharacterised protein [Chlamydia trachomatis]
MFKCFWVIGCKKFLINTVIQHHFLQLTSIYWSKNTRLLFVIVVKRYTQNRYICISFHNFTPLPLIHLKTVLKKSSPCCLAIAFSKSVTFLDPLPEAKVPAPQGDPP